MENLATEYGSDSSDESREDPLPNAAEPLPDNDTGPLGSEQGGNRALTALHSDGTPGLTTNIPTSFTPSSTESSLPREELTTSIPPAQSIQKRDRRRGGKRNKRSTTGLPAEWERELRQTGVDTVSFVDVNAQQCVSAAVSDADRAAAERGAILQQQARVQTVSRAQKRTHHISSLAASAVAGIAVRKQLKKQQRDAGDASR